ncbi:oxidoreductase [Aureococcus anophagefferens]|nr:oxidoreductase [Aureococcus anophagefferens]
MAAPMRSRRSSRRGLLALLGVSIVFAADVTQEQCEKWAASGECEKNSKFMLVTCREACASNHRRSPDYAAAYHCELWAGEGECAANVPFMNRECASRRRPVALGARGDAAELRVDRVDLYYLHSPFGFNRGEKTRVADAWRALVELRDAGTIGALGLSNFNARDLRQFANDADLGGLRMPDVVQNKFDPYRRGDQSPAERDDVVGLCATLGVAVVAYSQLSGWPFGVGALADPLLAQIAAANGASVASVVSKWVLDAGHAAIPRSSNASHVRANLAVLDAWPAPLAPAERAAIDGLNHLVAFREDVAAGPDALGVKAAKPGGRATTVAPGPRASSSNGEANMDRDDRDIMLHEAMAVVVQHREGTSTR